jgi:hypothetical protein
MTDIKELIDWVILRISAGVAIAWIVIHLALFWTMFGPNLKSHPAALHNHQAKIHQPHLPDHHHRNWRKTAMKTMMRGFRNHSATLLIGIAMGVAGTLLLLGHTLRNVGS